MKPKTPKELIDKARRAYQEPGGDPIPFHANFADRVVEGLSKTPKQSSNLVLIERASYGGVALAACLTLITWVHGLDSTAEPPESANAAELWLDMPMNDDF